MTPVLKGISFKTSKSLYLRRWETAGSGGLREERKEMCKNTLIAFINAFDEFDINVVLA